MNITDELAKEWDQARLACTMAHAQLNDIAQRMGVMNGTKISSIDNTVYAWKVQRATVAVLQNATRIIDDALVELRDGGDA